MKKKYLKVTGSLQDYKTWLETEEAGTPSVAYLTGDDEVVYSVDYPVLPKNKIIGTLVDGTSSFSFKLNGTTVNATVFEEDGKTKFSYEEATVVTSLDDAFSGNTALVSIDLWTIPFDQTATTVRTFKGCSNLTTLFFFHGQTSIGNSCFSNCTSLSGQLVIPNTVTTIGSFVFSACGGLTSAVNVPEGSTDLSASTFQNCSGLTSITLPTTTTKMAPNYLKGCTSLTSITVKAVTPPDASTASSSMFLDTNNCPIYVPSASVNTYKAASGWSDFSSRIQAIQ